MKCGRPGCETDTQGDHLFCWACHKALPSGIRQRIARWYGAMSRGSFVSRSGATVPVTLSRAKAKYDKAISEALALFRERAGG
jgi:hypothetical protein